MERRDSAGMAERGLVERGVAWKGLTRRGKGTAGMDRHELKAHRKRLGLSLAQAAAQVHVSARTWAHWEKGDRHIPEAVVHLFCVLNKIRYQSTTSFRAS
jgi:DNA-binding transcriptional regulator YiaG